MHPKLRLGSVACRQIASTLHHNGDESYLDLHMLQVSAELGRDAASGASAGPAPVISVIGESPVLEQRTEAGRERR